MNVACSSSSSSDSVPPGYTSSSNPAVRDASRATRTSVLSSLPVTWAVNGMPSAWHCESRSRESSPAVKSQKRSLFDEQAWNNSTLERRIAAHRSTAASKSFSQSGSSAGRQ